MSTLIAPLIAGVFAAFTITALAVDSTEIPTPTASVATAVPSSEQIEKDLQRLSWNQFKTVIVAVPKLKADVDAYGPMGWQYVQANYKTHAWRKNVSKLDDVQKTQLAELIRKAKGGKDL